MAESSNQYPTIEIGPGTFALDGLGTPENRLEAGRYALVPLLAGWRLDRQACPNPDCENGEIVLGTADGEPAVFGDCLTCRGAGGFPVLMRPCDNCDDGSVKGVGIDGREWEVACLAPGCVGGMLRMEGTPRGEQ